MVLCTVTAASMNLHAARWLAGMIKGVPVSKTVCKIVSESGRQNLLRVL